MKRRKFFLDPKIVLRKKDVLMERQLAGFSEIFGRFEKCQGKHYTNIGETETVIISYEEEAKFASKFFATCIALEMKNVWISLGKQDWNSRVP